jgi:hypothetical protein
VHHREGHARALVPKSGNRWNRLKDGRSTSQRSHVHLKGRNNPRGGRMTISFRIFSGNNNSSITTLMVSDSGSEDCYAIS